MEKIFLIKGGKFATVEKVLESGYIVIKDDKIEEVSESKEIPRRLYNYPVIWVKDNGIVMPGFIDPHLHGAGGADTMDATTEALRVISKTLLQEGTTSFLATTMTMADQCLEQALQQVAVSMQSEYSGAEILGIHLEGPFINPKQKGAQAKEYIQLPNLEKFLRWQSFAKGNIRLVTIAPEEEGAITLINQLRDQGVIPSVGHSDATYGEVQKALEVGLKHATHLFNAMRPMHHREPGVVGAVLLAKDLVTEVIADGIHISEPMLQLAYNLKGSKRLQLVTDSIRAKGLPEGEYNLGGQKVVIKQGEARLYDGRLAGSVLKMNEAVRRVARITGGNLVDLVRLSSANAAEELGLANRKGNISPGYDADLVLLSSDFEVETTICRGQIFDVRKSL